MRLVNFPYVMVRLRCDVCKRAGSYRLARLAAKYGPEIDLDDLLDRMSQDCPWRDDRKPLWKLDAKLVDYRFHDNRHTAATRFLRATGNLKLCQMFLRHDNIATTMKYAHATNEDLRQALNKVAESRKKPRKRVAPAKKRSKTGRF